MSEEARTREAQAVADLGLFLAAPSGFEPPLPP